MCHAPVAQHHHVLIIDRLTMFSKSQRHEMKMMLGQKSAVGGMKQFHAYCHRDKLSEAAYT